MARLPKKDANIENITRNLGQTLTNRAQLIIKTPRARTLFYCPGVIPSSALEHNKMRLETSLLSPFRMRQCSPLILEPPLLCANWVCVWSYSYSNTPAVVRSRSDSGYYPVQETGEVNHHPQQASCDTLGLWSTLRGPSFFGSSDGAGMNGQHTKSSTARNCDPASPL